jgi:hypothetical protein
MRGQAHLERDHNVLAGGIGQPSVTTDYPSVQRALDIAESGAPENQCGTGALCMQRCRLTESHEALGSGDSARPAPAS